MSALAMSDVARWIRGESISNPAQSTGPSIEEISSRSSSASQSDITSSTSSGGFLPLQMGLPQEAIQEWGTIISQSKRSKISVHEVIDSMDIPSYPKTTPLGVAHFVHFSTPLLQPGTSKEEAWKVIKAQMSKVQFSIHKEYFKETTLSLLGEKGRKDKINSAWHASYKCSGILHCEYAHPEILGHSLAYSDVQLHQINTLRSNITSEYAQLNAFQQTTRHTEAWFHSIKEGWQEDEGPCYYQNPLLTTPTRMCHGQKPTVFTRNGVFFLGCNRNSDTEPWHAANAIPAMQTRVDLDYLKALANDDHQPTHAACSYVGHATERRKKCGFDHPQGQGNVLPYVCDARLDIYIPRYMARYPFLVLVARGKHHHHPPFPTRLPQDIASDVVDSLKQVDILAMTSRRFILSPQYQQLLEKHNVNSLRATYDAFNIEDRLTALIRKERILQFPEGTALAGAEREYAVDRHKDNQDQWIRRIVYLNETQFIIICCTFEQAKAFADAEHIEMGLSFKMVAGKITLYSISGWHDAAKRNLVYCYAFLNCESRVVYKALFENMFDVLSQAARKTVKFCYLDSTARGIKTIGLDMCKKQAGGLGDFLHDKDPSRAWDEHLKHIVVFCSVHLKRNLREKHPTHPFRHQLHTSLWTAESKDEILERMQRICAEYPELRNHCKNKKAPWILAGLTRSESKIRIEWWQAARKHTGNNESSHFQDNNFTSRKTSLVNAILKAKIHINGVYDSVSATLQGFHRTWTNQSETARRQQHPELLYNPENPNDTPLAGTRHMQGTETASSTPVPSIGLDGSEAGSIRASPNLSISSAYAATMPPPPTPLRRKRVQRQQSTSQEPQNQRLLELEAHVARRRAKKQRLDQEKRDQERERELLAELEELKEYASDSD